MSGGSDVTVPMLERVRRRLRELIKLIEKKERKIVYTDCEDVMGPESEIALAGLPDGADYVRFKAKARDFLRAHQDHIAINNLRMNKRMTAADLAELERMLAQSATHGWNCEAGIDDNSTNRRRARIAPCERPRINSVAALS